jgi:5'-3' exonuclease
VVRRVAMRLHLVDGTYELFRAHFSPRPGTTAPDGRDVKATVGLVSSLLYLLADAEERATHVAVAFDNPIVSFRNDLFAGYKSDEGVPLELRSQFDIAEAATAALGVAVWSMDRWEADDAMATGAVRFRDEVEQVRLMTPDKDMNQLLDGDRVVQVDRMRNKLIDVGTLRAGKGIGPASVPDWLALVGDAADGIPGIPGFGAKAASAVLAHYEHIENIPRFAHEWKVDVRGAKRLATSLDERRDDAMLYKKLATLVTDAELPHTLADLEWRGAPRDTWVAWCGAMGREDFLDRPTKWI